MHDGRIRDAKTVLLGFHLATELGSASC
jgi:hypothetical protein